jgi:hypothetical protein
MILLKLIIIKVKLQLIFNPAEQSILTVRINDLCILYVCRGKRNPNLSTLVDHTLTDTILVVLQ